MSCHNFSFLRLIIIYQVLSRIQGSLSFLFLPSSGLLFLRHKNNLFLQSHYFFQFLIPFFALIRTLQLCSAITALFHICLEPNITNNSKRTRHTYFIKSLQYIQKTTWANSHAYICGPTKNLCIKQKERPRFA